MKRLVFLLALVLCCSGASLTPPKGTYTLNCNGTNDTGEISTAINNTAFNTIYVPATVCMITSTIAVTAASLSGTNIVGVDRYASIIRAAPASNMAQMFNDSGSGTAAPFVIRNLTLDANYGSQTAANPSRIWYFAGTPAVADMTFTQVQFLNCGYSACLGFNSGGGATRVNISDNTFSGAQCYQIDMIKTSNFLIHRNIFSNYNIRGSASDCPAVRWTNTYANNNEIVSDNIFIPLVAKENAIEGNSATGVPLTGFTISGNTCNANATGGCGINVACAFCSIVGNAISNGSPTLSSGSDGTALAAGIEVTPYYVTVEGNSLQNGEIMILTNTGLCAYCVTGVNVIGNMISNASSTASGPVVIDVVGITNFVIAKNNILTNYTGSVSGSRGIFLGYSTQTGATVIGQGLVTENVYNAIGSVNDQCIRLLTTSSSQITIKGNVCQGNAVGMTLPSTTVDTNLTIVSNDFYAATAGVSGTAIGTGNLITNNKTSVLNWTY
jgi:hypothetical protein